MSNYYEDDLAVYVVWMPVLSRDDAEASVEAQVLVPDGRATHFWSPDQNLGIIFGEKVELPAGRELAWDIYFTFEPGVEWKNQLPTPFDFAHQLGDDDRYLGDGTRLWETVEFLLAAAHESEAAAH